MKINNIAELKTRRGTSNANVEVLGYYTSGDGGGGSFYWDNLSVETDNGGTIVKVTDLTTGRWKRLYSDKVNVKWFGMKGDGATNEATLLNTILSNIPSKTYVYFPSGTYKLNSTITVNINKIRLIGEKTKLDFSSLDINSNAMYFTGQTVTSNGWFQTEGGMEGFEIYGSGTTGTSIGLRFASTVAEQPSAHLNFRNCNISNFATGITITDNAYLISFHHCEIHFNKVGYFQPQTTTTYPPGLINSGERVSFIDCNIFGNTLYGLYLNWDGADTHLVNCSLDFNGQYTTGGSQIYLKSGQLHITNCHIETNTSQTIIVPPGNIYDAIISITNSYIIQFTGSGAVSHIDFQGFGNLTIVGGKIWSPPTDTTNLISLSSTCCFNLIGTRILFGGTNIFSITNGCKYYIMSNDYNNGNITASGFQTVDSKSGYFSNGEKEVTCSVLNTWYSLGMNNYGGLYLFRDASLGGHALCLWDAGVTPVTPIESNITGFEFKYDNVAEQVVVRVTSGSTPRRLKFVALITNKS